MRIFVVHSTNNYLIFFFFFRLLIRATKTSETSLGWHLQLQLQGDSSRYKHWVPTNLVCSGWDFHVRTTSIGNVVNTVGTQLHLSSLSYCSCCRNVHILVILYPCKSYVEACLLLLVSLELPQLFILVFWDLFAETTLFDNTICHALVLYMQYLSSKSSSNVESVEGFVLH